MDDPMSKEAADQVPDLDHARRQRRGWYLHLGIFLVVQGALLVLVAYTPFDGSQLRVLSDDPDTARRRFDYARNLWVLILVIDFFWSFSYTWWRPRMKRRTE